MARTRETGPRRATRAAAADELEDPPPRTDDDIDDDDDDDADLFDNDKEEDNGGDNLDANIRANTIAMFQRVLTFRPHSTTTSKSPTLNPSVSSTTMRSRSSVARSPRTATRSP